MFFSFFNIFFPKKSGVAQPNVTLGGHYNTIEEARADLFGLYYIMDKKLVDLGVIPHLDAAKAEYNDYMRNGLLRQLLRLKVGDDVEEAHMRNRQMICKWVLERALPSGAIKRLVKDGKTFFKIFDYDAVRTLFGDMLREIQRIKSQGDTAACIKMMETYAVKVDPELHKEVIDRFSKYNIRPYSGMVNPRLVPVHDEKGEILDVKVEYVDDFVQQHLEYSKKYTIRK